MNIFSSIVLMEIQLHHKRTKKSNNTAVMLMNFRAQAKPLLTITFGFMIWHLLNLSILDQQSHYLFLRSLPLQFGLLVVTLTNVEFLIKFLIGHYSQKSHLHYMVQYLLLQNLDSKLLSGQQQWNTKNYTTKRKMNWQHQSMNILTLPESYLIMLYHGLSPLSLYQFHSLELLFSMLLELNSQDKAKIHYQAGFIPLFEII